MERAARCFLNVDLELESDEDLTLLVRTLDPATFVLERPPGRVAFELNEPVKPLHPEPLILEFIRLVMALPRPARDLWDRCTRRAFDIGFQSSEGSFQEAHRLSTEALRQIAGVGAEVAMTVYGRLPDEGGLACRHGDSRVRGRPAAYACGTYATGEFFVVANGGATITAVTPAARRAARAGRESVTEPAAALGQPARRLRRRRSRCRSPRRSGAPW